ncbi:MAG: L,D-transpeptidase, partial [Blastocatellia bacterium]
HQKGHLSPQKTKLGGEIYIHGGPAKGDWTKGCIALDDRDMLQLFKIVPVSTEVSILP